jgi:hypothetical protein
MTKIYCHTASWELVRYGPVKALAAAAALR